MRKRQLQAYPLEPVSGNAANREQKEAPILSARRIRANIHAILVDEASWLTTAYTLAIQAESLLQVIEGKRELQQ